jgi:hypothetical protein
LAALTKADLIQLLRELEASIPKRARGHWAEGPRLMWGMNFSVPYESDRDSVSPKLWSLLLKYEIDLRDEGLTPPWPVLVRHILDNTEKSEFSVTYYTMVPTRLGVWNNKAPSALLPYEPIAESAGS